MVGGLALAASRARVVRYDGVGLRGVSAIDDGACGKVGLRCIAIGRIARDDEGEGEKRNAHVSIYASMG
jgi:hypothetical protein